MRICHTSEFAAYLRAFLLISQGFHVTTGDSGREFRAVANIRHIARLSFSATAAATGAAGNQNPLRWRCQMRKRVKPEALGVIVGDAVYRLDVLREELKLGDHAMRQARRAGLRVRRIGRRGYVLGKDILAFIEASGK